MTWTYREVEREGRPAFRFTNPDTGEIREIESFGVLVEDRDEMQEKLYGVARAFGPAIEKRWQDGDPSLDLAAEVLALRGIADNAVVAARVIARSADTSRVADIVARLGAIATESPWPWGHRMWPPTDGPGSAEYELADANGNTVVGGMGTPAAVALAVHAPADLAYLLSRLDEARGFAPGA